jgi:hypothetical protein
MRGDTGRHMMTPDYEVKLLLAPAAVLGPDRKLTSSVRAAFGIPASVLKMNVQFLDTDSKEIYDNGWCPRVRKTEGEPDFELTYKKRYPITGGDIDSALATAAAEGFGAEATGYEAQIEWGYARQTLSIGRTKRTSSAGSSGMELPGTAASRSILIAQAPGKFDDWVAKGWGTRTLATARIYGPVLAKRWIGAWSGMKLFIEVWPIRNAAGTGTDDFVEASFKTTIRATASSKHDSLVDDLQSKGWLLAEDSLKTKLIMDRY